METTPINPHLALYLTILVLVLSGLALLVLTILAFKLRSIQKKLRKWAE